ncbi:acyltransferase family protein [Flavobacterium ajazii]|uniref:acyltransferase family protein n=1 Tax=Flavobacterium ajazii TaxID=2692318 RepID=UPI0013D2C4F5|nr:acyltransferase [Flavobacterium ajazii]
MDNNFITSAHINGRIKILDGFRAIAIIAVVFYHYFYRWNDAEKPYYGADFFHYGFRGVPFFFMISGFVICYTLEGTNDRIAFWKKRFIRLFPSMLIASVITFVFLKLFDSTNTFDGSNHFRNLVTSITFLPPNVFDLIFGTKNHFSYINYSYWSLWPEIQFYFLASTIYFADKYRFERNFIVTCFILLLLFYGLLFLGLNHIKLIEKLINLFNLIQYLSFFLSGALFFMLYKNKSNFWYLLFLAGTFILVNLYFVTNELVSFSVMFGLFFLFVYYPETLSFFENRIVVKIGFCSYFLYLIHENIGVAWIRRIVHYFYPYSFIAPLLIIVFMIGFSILYTQKVESKIIKFLNKILFKKKYE